MSALDQAFIKAYAKDSPAGPALAGEGPQAKPSALRASAALAAAPSAARARAVATQTAQSQIIEQIYCDGALYRIDAPVPTARRRVAVPAPHFQLPPRNSPRRNVRRSLLKLLGHESESATPMPVEPPIPAALAPRRPIRKVAPLARQQAEPAPAPAIELPVQELPVQELPPEVIFDAPHHADLPDLSPPAIAPAGPTPSPFLLPQIPSAPDVAPLNLDALNLAAQFGPGIEVHGHWESELLAGPGALVVLPEPADLHLIEPAPLLELKLVELQLEPLPIAPPSEATVHFRLDAAHAAPAGRPHAKFVPPTTDTPDEPEAIAAIEPEADATPAEDAYFGEASQDDDEPAPLPPIRELDDEYDLTFADLDPVAAEATIAAAASIERELERVESEQGETSAANDCVPVWEVDRFQWPAAVERLVSDKTGYFGQASERLLAAVADGLKILAITGSRRGEGRTTLALCLARAAAKAGIHVAVVDADFARPQLAAKIGLDFTHGWQDAAIGEVPLSETAIRSLADNITILPLEASAARAALSLADPRVTATLRAAAATFELVIVDLGPLNTGDGELFPPGEGCPLDAAIVVRDLRYASAAESEAVGERLYRAGIEAVGVAENFVAAEEVSPPV
ncbi:MAG: cellulose synthase operon protein YhjQ/BcsQ [Pirellulaceae bacterium]